jgi:hypothetical protein
MPEKAEKLTYFSFSQTHEPDRPHNEHSEERMCRVEGDTTPVKAVCPCCGRYKEYFAGESRGYVFICNGQVIMRHREDGLHLWGRQITHDGRIEKTHT